MIKLSTNSKAKYETLHEDLRIIIDEALNLSTIDFGISEGHRPVEKQMEYYKKGRTYINGEWVITDKSKVITYVDGIVKKGKHNYNPSMAFDFYVYIPGKSNMTYDPTHLTALGYMFVILGNKLYKEGKISHKVRWGGNFDQDWEILEPGSFRDSPHVELMNN